MAAPSNMTDTDRSTSTVKTYSTVQMYSKRNAPMHAMNSTAMVFFLPRNSIIRTVTINPAYIRKSIL